MRNIDNNSIDATLNHSVSIVWFLCYTEGQIALCETMRYRCLLSQMRRNNENVIFLSNASSLYMLKIRYNATILLQTLSRIMIATYGKLSS